MVDQLHSYFQEEKMESLVFLLIGIIAIGMALSFWLVVKKPLYNGLAVPLLVVGLIQIVVGGTVFYRTDAQVAALKRQLEVSHEEFVEKELPRMQAVNKWFGIYRIIELSLAVIAAGIIWYAFGKEERGFWLGLGVGLLIQSVFMLGLDFLAEYRAEVYTQQIEVLQDA